MSLTGGPAATVASHVGQRPTARFDWRGRNDRRGATAAGGMPRTDPSIPGELVLAAAATKRIYASRRPI